MYEAVLGGTYPWRAAYRRAQNPGGIVTAKRTPSRAKQLASKADVRIICRAIGHNWGFTTGYGVVDKKGITQVNWGWMKLACTRQDANGVVCEMQSERTSDPFTRLIGRTCKRPKDYGIVGAGRGDWRREAREEFMRRFAGPPPRGRSRRAKKG